MASPKSRRRLPLSAELNPYALRTFHWICVYCTLRALESYSYGLIQVFGRYADLNEENAMPIYEYCCRECGHSLEVIQKLADAPLTDCPVCSRPTLKKQVSAPSFRLSGGGWYETDFKTGDKKNIAGEKADGAGKGAAQSEQGGSSGKNEKKSESKPASPPASESAKAG